MSHTIRKIGITGAGGNIGTTLRKGWEGRFDLTLFDLKDAPTTASEKSVRLDCGDRDQLKGAFSNLDALIHLAGDPRPNAPPESTLRNNFASTSYVFEEARLAGVKKLIFASSNFYHEGDLSRALQQRQIRSIRLDRPPTPQCLYGESKVFGETVGRHLSHLGIHFAALRIGWTVPEDSPVRHDSAYMRAVFCSHRDLVEAFTKALEFPREFVVGFAVSNNDDNVFDLSGTREHLGFHPQDNSAAYFR